MRSPRLSLDCGRARLIKVADDTGRRQPAERPCRRPGRSRTVRRGTRDLEYRRVVLAAVARPRDLCVDVGANARAIARTFVAVAPVVPRLLVEALPPLAQRLTADFRGCEVRGAALTDREGEADFIVVVDRPTRSGLEPERLAAGAKTRVVKVPLSTLDLLLAGRRPRVVKADGERAELKVPRRAQGTLASTPPLIVFEHGRLESARRDRPGAIHELFTELAYRVFDIDALGPLSADEFVGAASAGGVWNFLAGASVDRDPDGG